MASAAKKFIITTAAVVGLTFGLDALVNNLHASSPKAKSAQVQEQKYVELNDANYKKEVLEHKGPCIVMFYDSDTTRAPNSARMSKVMDALMQMYGNQIKFCKYDEVKNHKGKRLSKSQINTKLKNKYGVLAYPTTIWYKNGKEIDRLKSGPKNLEYQKKWINQLIPHTKKLYNL